jgi:hypothetical protein
MMMLKLVLTLLLVALPSLAGAATDDPPDLAERTKYATLFHDARPLRPLIDRQIDTFTQRVNPEEREDFLRHVQLRIDYDGLEDKSIQAMARLYTVPELKAMIAYYGSPEGKSAETKSDAYAAQIGPEIGKALDGALMDTRFGK